jgi:serine O-acetyltransferase
MELFSDYMRRHYGGYISAEVDELLRKFDTTIFEPCELALSIYRIQHELYLRGLESIEAIKVLSLLQRTLCAVEIYYSAEIGENLLIVHGLGTVIGPGVLIGNNCTVYQNVTLGTKYDTSKKKCRIGNDVIVYAGAKILGDISVGNNAVIGANSVVLTDVGDYEVFAGVPAKRVGVVDSDKYKLPPGRK